MSDEYQYMGIIYRVGQKLQRRRWGGDGEEIRGEFSITSL